MEEQFRLWSEKTALLNHQLDCYEKVIRLMRVYEGLLGFIRVVKVFIRVI